ncbi:MAG TPA: hypothetical protein VGP76_28695 [Planctomycetaceae bacterium]|nr:hypothetical protein [Planctomycetaceae bacterium]
MSASVFFVGAKTTLTPALSHRNGRGWKSGSSVRLCKLRIPFVAFAALSLFAPGLSAQDGHPDYRKPDQRPHHDDARLSSLGIVATQSKRLKLYTDGPIDRVQSVGPAADALYEALVEYFGPLPPARDGSEFSVTGYLMADKQKFRDAGLLPESLPPFLNGRHRDLEFWVNEQETDYYRRHLILHEFTHCFMYAPDDVHIPTWYREGMAELFGTHAVDAAGHSRFRAMPDAAEHFAGHGRIPLVRTETAAGRWKSLEDVERIAPNKFLETPAYAWSWAACAFLDGHPRYARKFHDLGRHTTGLRFDPALRELFDSGGNELRTEWSLFTHELQYGFDLPRAAIQFQPGKPLAGNDSAHSVDVAADRGWQSSGVLVHAGAEYEVSANGEVRLANVPKPWISQPQGVSILYSEGRPIGQLLAAIHREPADPKAEESMLNQIAVGRGTRFVATTTGTLYFRVNDHWNSLADNDGHYRVTIRELAAHK